MKRLIAFDLDGTLAESKQPVSDEMAGLLKDLLEIAQVAVISGGDWPQFEKQVVERLPAGTRLERLFIMPTTGTKLYRFEDGNWRQIYAELFSREERDRIVAALDKAGKTLGLDSEKTWGERVEDRGSQITFSALGQSAPLDAKSAWDPGKSKRTKLQETLNDDLDDLSIKVGGATSIDVTRKGVDKGYAIGKLGEHSGLVDADMLFIGDAITPGGNDYAVSERGVDVVPVCDVSATRSVVQALIVCLKSE